MKFIGGAVVLVMIGLFGLVYLVSSGQQQRVKDNTVGLDAWNYSLHGFDNILHTTGTLRNDGFSPRKDVEIQCDTYGASGTKIDTNNRTVYQIVPAQGSIQIYDFDMGFVHPQHQTFRCAVIGSTAT